MIATLDIDGVILDFVTEFCSVSREHGYDLKYHEIDQYNIAKVLGIDNELFLSLINATITSKNISPYIGASHGINILRDEGFHIRLLTSRAKEHHPYTLEALSAGDMKFDEICYAPHGEKHLHTSDARFVVEDSYEEAIKIAESGIRVFLISHPWNSRFQHLELENSNNLVWVTGWDELVTILGNAL